MAFTFIHTADWQLGKTFGQFPADVASALRRARQDAIVRIAEQARSVKAAHILVAGDVWDNKIPSNSTLRQPLAIMAEASDLSWWLLPGNHDPDGIDGLWDRISNIKPDNVHLLREPQPVEIEAGVFILPAPWARIQHGQDLTQWMETAETPSGALRIGLAHGGVKGFGSEAETDREIIPPNRADKANLDYLALGDWHAQTQINTRTFYPGTPEPDKHKTGERGQVLAVTLEAGKTPLIKALKTAEYDWVQLSIALQTDTIPETIDKIRGALLQGQALRHTHVQLDISGEMTVAEWTEFESFIEDMKGETASFDVRGDTTIRLVVVPEDIESLDAQGSVREAAETLVAQSEDPDLSREDRQIASEALRLLFRYASETA